MDSQHSKQIAQQIARQFLPSRWHYHYTHGKLRGDPLYAEAVAALRNTRAEVLDVGCGIGLLAHCLRADGVTLRYHGVDHDAAKIARARIAAQALPEVTFTCLNLDQSLPTHRGSVVLLDVLQYVRPETRVALLEHACQSITPQGCLVIRTGLADGSWRYHATHVTDLFTRAIGWMKSGPRQYPTRAELEAACARAGLVATFKPLWGNTPFNNWLVIAAPKTTAPLQVG